LWIFLRKKKRENRTVKENGENNMVREIEFNNGFVTALALFYGHREQAFEARTNIILHDLRIYCASDHLLDLEIPENISIQLKRKIKSFIRRVLSKRLESISWKEGDKFFDECADLLKEIDQEIFNLKVQINYH
jgi:hypothetical protein